MDNTEKQVLLEKIIKLTLPLVDLKKKLGDNYEDFLDIDDLVVLTREQMRKIMNMYLDDEISAEQLSEWAELVEGRDGIAYEDGHEQNIADVLFWISEPEINSKVTKNKIKEYIGYLA